MPLKQTICALLLVLIASTVLYAGDLRIPLPKGSKTTPVQELNRQGVEALRKNQFEKAKGLFYKAYLYDPDDPFTLNNLGYVSELEGQVDRAARFYQLAGQGASSAVVDRASTKEAEGKTVAEVAGNVPDRTMQVNRQNVEAIRLMSQGRAPEAELLLRGTLAIEPGNPFTLNNFAVASEMEGDYDKALQYYTAAARTNSSETAIVTLDKNWRGKPVVEMAAEGAKRVRDRMGREQSLAAQVGRLNLRGVSALNRNSLYDARQFFEQAYKLDPNNAFVLNNRGFLAEMDGDPESARYFYEKARHSDAANARIGFANNQSAEGRKLFEVAADNDQKMDTKMTTAQEARRRRTGQVQLKRRDNSVVTSPSDQAPPPPLIQLQQEPEKLGPPQPPIPQLAPRPSQPQTTQPPPNQPQ
jgi:Flp pilus assembly protein TadD